MSWKGILSFDFDGTLYAAPEIRPRIDPEFNAKLENYLKRGYAWGINTGRDYDFLQEGLKEAKITSPPHFIISREREIYFWDEDRQNWIADQPWKKECETSHDQLFQKEKQAIANVKQYILEETQAEWVSVLGDPAGLIASNMEEMAKILQKIENEIAEIPELSILYNTVYLRFSHTDFHKGTSLQHVAKLLDVSKENIFVCGDGENDLGMLCDSVAGMMACPSNAEKKVQERIKQQGGYIATQSASQGTLQALKHFLK